MHEQLWPLYILVALGALYTLKNIITYLKEPF
jgi:hypothetical protein